MYYITMTCNAKFVALHVTSISAKHVMDCNAIPLHLAFPEARYMYLYFDILIIMCNSLSPLAS